MPQIQLVDGNQVFGSHRIFLDIQQPGTPKIDNAKPFHLAHHFADTVIFGARTVVHQITQLNIIGGPAVVWIDHRKAIKPI